MSAIMKSISPKECERIANGEQTVLVSKTRPKIDTPFKCYIYCTKGENLWLTQKGVKSKTELTGYLMNGKVIGEFVCDRITDISVVVRNCNEDYNHVYHNDECKGSCLTWKELQEYGNGKPLYAWHISDLKIYDKPKELGEFYKPLKYDEDGVICGTKQEMSNIYEWDCETVFNKKHTKCTLKECPQLQKFYRLNRTPKSWYYVEEL